MKVHILDGFHHADNMEHFAKAALKRANKISSIEMHYVECNRNDINTKQMDSMEDKLKSISGSLKSGDFLAIPGLAPVSILNLQDRIKNVLGRNIRLTANNISSYRTTLMEFLKQIYNTRYRYSSEVSAMDRNSQGLEYTYGVISEIDNLRRKGVKVYIPAGHGADSTIKWMAKDKGLGNELYKYIATGNDTNGQIRNLLNQADRNNYYDFNLLSLANAKIVNVKDRFNRDYIFGAKDGFINDSERGVYNFSPVRDSYGRLKGYSYHDETTVEYPYSEYTGNERISGLCKFVGLPYSDFVSSYSEDRQFKDAIRRGRSTSYLPDKLYRLRDVFNENEIRQRKLGTLGTLINREQNFIFDTNSDGKVIFQKTNCEGSQKPSVVSMWGSCFSAINAMKRDLTTSPTGGYNSGGSLSQYVSQAERCQGARDYNSAEYYYNRALDILHPDKNTFRYERGTIDTYEKLYKVLKYNGKNPGAKGIANMIIDLMCNEIKNMSVLDSTYMAKQKIISRYYNDLAEYCEKDYEHYPAKVCRWAAEQLDRSTTAGDRIVQRRAEKNQYIGDLYNEYSKN